MTLLSDVYSNNILGNGDGGGICTYSPDTRFSVVNVYGNSATLTGGGIFVGKHLLMEYGQIHGNSAGGNGGGIYVDTNTQVWETRSILIRVKITNNEAGGKGGGIYVKTGLLVLSNLTAFSGNKAALGFDGGTFLPPGDIFSHGMPVGAQAIQQDPG